MSKKLKKEREGNLAVETTDKDGKGFGTLGDQLKDKMSTEKAANLLVNAAGFTKSDLPELDTVEQLSDEEVVAMEEEGQRRKEWAENAGTKLAEIESQIAKLRSNRALMFSAKGKETLKKLEAAREQILGVDDQVVQARVAFSRLLEGVRSTDVTSAQAIVRMMKRLVSGGRYRIPEQSEIDSLRDPKTRRINGPSGTIFFGGNTYFSCYGENGASDGQRALEAEVRKVVRAYKAGVVERIKDSEHANHDLAGFSKGELGMYYMYIPPREGKNGRKWTEGHIIVEVFDRNARIEGKTPFEVIAVRDATGSCTQLATGDGRKTIPFFWYSRGEVISGTNPDGSRKRLKEEDFRLAVRILRTLQNGVNYWKNQQKESGKNPAPKKKTTPKKKAEPKKKAAPKKEKNK